MEKLNIAEILKDCPKGMELDCTLFEDVHFDCIDDVCDIIKCYIQDSKHKTGLSFNRYGCYSNISKSKCVIFPKGKTTWEGFQRPFKDGDVVTDIEGEVIIYKGITTYGYCGSFVSLDRYNQLIPHYESYLTDCIRLSTEEEKQKLFDAIKDNGYKWNGETKTLEKINKFDITTLKPFDKVLVRDTTNQYWSVNLFGYYLHSFLYPFCCSGNCTTTGFKQCIPYEGNEHLLGTTNDCDEYYKTWE